MSMKPGATTCPLASSSRSPLSPVPTSTIVPSLTATSAWTPGAPVPSITVPPLITMSAAMSSPSGRSACAPDAMPRGEWRAARRSAGALADLDDAVAGVVGVDALLVQEGAAVLGCFALGACRVGAGDRRIGAVFADELGPLDQGLDHVGFRDDGDVATLHEQVAPLVAGGD